jgi:8-oxo-dGTP diphosphatase
VTEHDGNGWVDCCCGHRHWGRYGAAGLALVQATGDTTRLLMQLRAGWTHEGGSWGLPGGARDSHEDAVTAALREAAEETGISPGQVKILGDCSGTDHGEWSYTYVLGLTTTMMPAMTPNAESVELRWVPVTEVGSFALHPALRRTWPTLLRELSHRLPRRHEIAPLSGRSSGPPR